MFVYELTGSRPQPGRPTRRRWGGIAPALVISAEQDILREEAGRYAQRLRAADALIEHLDLRGVGHAFNMGGAGPDVVVPVYEKIVESVQLVFA
ncbi:alpha/beta hydrolase fold domain-containing protein [Nesterenkonia jeotgali]|uniref:Alpha/beta hydrolase fold-3 domain-containing protein n=1 Tax=Nesterenkonia jeotgali TaxID=317018 RepID=A0A0W8ICJ8_9MICC|nr:alpha/beta hydrolase fold domain-containing protein [Nesterenkonia jeotgali]KUG57689.1 hypothetical protein AVL63_03920 [Nesterenkonia jeotgali]